MIKPAFLINRASDMTETINNTQATSAMVQKPCEISILDRPNAPDWTMAIFTFILLIVTCLQFILQKNQHDFDKRKDKLILKSNLQECYYRLREIIKTSDFSKFTITPEQYNDFVLVAERLVKSRVDFEAHYNEERSKDFKKISLSIDEIKHQLKKSNYGNKTIIDVTALIDDICDGYSNIYNFIDNDLKK